MTRPRGLEVYVDVPRLPNRPAVPNPTFQAAPTPTSQRIVYVEIPYSPLWQSSKNGQLTPGRPSRAIPDFTAPRPRPLTDHNAPYITRQNEATEKKRKAKDEDETETQEALKKQRKTAPLYVAEPNVQKVRKRISLKKRTAKTGPPKGQKTKNAPTSTQLLGADPLPLKLPTEPKKVAEPGWARIDTDLSKEEVERRMQIREFTHRFGTVLKIAKIHRESLDDYSHISDQAAKSMIIALLDVLASEISDEDLDDEITKTRNMIKKSPPSSSALWDFIDPLRTSQPQLGIAEPSVERVETGEHLIPVILSLIEGIADGPTIRDELQHGIEEASGAKLVNAPLIKKEHARWKVLKTKMNAEKENSMKKNMTDTVTPKFDIKQWRAEYRTQEQKHQATLKSLNMKLVQKLGGYQLRYLPAGIDFDGRVYYIPSYPAAGVQPPPNEEIDNFPRWSWFVSVWCGKEGTSSHMALEQNENDGWYAFSRPEDIRKLVKWLEWRKQDLDFAETVDSLVHQESLADDSDEEVEDIVATRSSVRKGQKDIKGLCKRLSEFADFLEWKKVGQPSNIV